MSGPISTIEEKYAQTAKTCTDLRNVIYDKEREIDALEEEIIKLKKRITEFDGTRFGL